MLNVCSNCHYLGKDKYNFSPSNIYYGVFGAIFGIIFLVTTYVSDRNLFYKLVALFMIITGIIFIRDFAKGRVCPNCNQKTMIPIDKPKAIELIKQYDLQPGVNKFPDNFKEIEEKPSSSFKAPES